MFHLSGKDDRLREWRLVTVPADDLEGSGNQAAPNSTEPFPLNGVRNNLSSECLTPFKTKEMLSLE